MKLKPQLSPLAEQLMQARSHKALAGKIRRMLEDEASTSGSPPWGNQGNPASDTLETSMLDRITRFFLIS